MEKTSSAIYGPVLEIIRQMQNAAPDEKSELEKHLYEISEKAFYEFQTFDNEFMGIRNAKMKLEDKIKSLNILLDKKMSEVSVLDMEDSMAACEITYDGFWKKLENYSQEYLAMANYLLKLFSKDDRDFSPSILEFGRAIENELVHKIYTGYVASLSGNTDGMIDHGRRYGELKNAVRKYSQNNGEYYIPARIMVKYLSYLSDENFENAYNDAFKRYLTEHGVDPIPISNSEFTDMATEIFEKFRNTAAHPGSTMESEDAEACKEKSGHVLKIFMNAICEHTYERNLRTDKRR